MTDAATVDGRADSRFTLVEEVFAENLARRGEVGAAVAVYLDGEKVVDLWGGHVVHGQKPAEPWQADTIVPMMSVNKGVTAICAHRLADRGELDYERPVAAYWPEFAQAGKERITVRQLISGQAALVFADHVPPGGVLDWDAMAEGLAKQAPAWEPGTRGAYHSATYGHLVGELVRRVSGKRPGQFFRDEIGDPMDLDYWFVVPEGERHRISEVLPNPGSVTTNAVAAGTSPLGRAWRVLPAPDLVAMKNDPAYFDIEMPSSGGRGNARAVGKLFAALSLGGTLDGFTVLSEATLDKVVTPQWEGTCGLTGRDFRYGMGLFLNSGAAAFMGPDKDTFGHPGAGGAIGFADRKRRLAFSYCTDFMCDGAGVGDRCEALINATYEAVAKA